MMCGLSFKSFFERHPCQYVNQHFWKSFGYKVIVEMPIMQPNRTSESNLTKETLGWNFKKPILDAFLGLLIMIHHSGATEITYKYGKHTWGKAFLPLPQTVPLLVIGMLGLGMLYPPILQYLKSTFTQLLGGGILKLYEPSPCITSACMYISHESEQMEKARTKTGWVGGWEKLTLATDRRHEET